MKKIDAVMTAMNLMMKTDAEQFADAIDILGKMVDSLERESNRPKKMTARQLDNVKLRDYIVANLPTVPTLVDEYMATIPQGVCAEPVTRNRVVAIFTQLKTDGVVVRTEEKGKPYYAKAVEVDLA